MEIQEFIKINNLSRDYTLEPLRVEDRISNRKEIPPLSDIICLHEDNFFSLTDISVYFKVSLQTVCNWFTYYGYKKLPDRNRSIITKEKWKSLGVEHSSQLESTKEKAKITNLERYGKEFPLQNKEVLDKQKSTLIKHYGVLNPALSKELLDKRISSFKKTINDTERGKEIREQSSLRLKALWQKPGYKERIIATNKSNHGGQFNLQMESFKEEIRNNNLERYGKENIAQVPETWNKIKGTNKLKYGAEFYSQTKDFIKKVEGTCQEKYGVSSYTKTEDYKVKSKKTSIKKYGVDSYTKTLECQERIYNTKKKNHSFIISSAEKDIEKFLIKKFPDLKTQYRDERYPFSCDFYIPSLDLFIEYQGNWTHGGEKYDANNVEHQNKIYLWKLKSTELNFKGKPKLAYLNAIETWTLKDPMKRQTAERNKLNWLEFFNKEDLFNHFNKV